MKSLFVFLLLFTFQTHAHTGMDLHNHLFIKDGVSWFFSGDCDEPLKAKSWKDQFSSKANYETLEKSDLALVVISFYAHPLFVPNIRDSIRKQIHHAEEFLKTHPDWVLAKTPNEARTALEKNKRVMIFSIEGAADTLETENDFKEFIDEKGIRIVTPLHLTDDHYGGVALMKGIQRLASPIAWIRSVFSPEYDSSGNVRVNSQGLTVKGRWLIQKLIEHHAWIDLAHSSDLAQKEIVTMMKKAHQPLLYTHTTLRRFWKAERGISDEQLDDVASTHGIVGIVPSDMMLDGTPTETNINTTKCPSSFYSFLEQYKIIALKIGTDSTLVGSDFNAPLTNLPPTCQLDKMTDKEGFWNLGQMPNLWRVLEKVAPIQQAHSQKNSVNQFIRTWQRVFDEQKN